MLSGMNGCRRSALNGSGDLSRASAFRGVRGLVHLAGLKRPAGRGHGGCLIHFGQIATQMHQPLAFLGVVVVQLAQGVEVIALRCAPIAVEVPA